MTENELAYLAGLVDGEGHVALTPSGREKLYRRPGLEIGNCDPRMIAWLMRRLGGQLYTQQRQGNRRLCYFWRLTGEAAIILLTAVRPYLVTKRKHVRQVLLYWQTRSQSGHRLSPKMRMLRLQAIMTLTALNKSGREKVVY